MRKSIPTANEEVSPEYKKLSAGMIAGLLFFPLPLIFFVIAGRYSPKTKLAWGIAAVLELILNLALLVLLPKFLEVT